MSNFLSLITAIFTGACVAITSWLLLTGSAKIKLEKNREYFKPIPLLFRLAMPFLPIFRPLSDSKLLEFFKENDFARLQMAGYDEVISWQDFAGLRIIFAFDAMIFLFIGAGGGNMMMCIIVATLFLFFPTMWLSGVIKKRHTSIMKALPNVLDLLTLSVESGRDLLSSLREILERRKPDPLGEELLRTFQEIQLGRKRTEALRALSKRVRQVDLSATVNAIIQAEEYGVSIGQLLRIQGDMQRAKRFALAEKMANESSVKIIIPVVVCILPAVFLILMGPLAMNAMRMFQ
ncbi:MAG: type II secretion system F family protein [Lentisphaerae bacterium]|nr:type II secretion system F family protein [Lentisphaerota bacterium]